MAKKEKKTYSWKDMWYLFITFFKVGLFTFGGGYAMIPLIEKEVCEKRKWSSNNELLDILAISESTPGPIAVNTATFVGYRVAGFLGSFFATLGLILPSFAIIYLISIFYNTFMSWKIVDAAFKGIKVGVIILLFKAFLKIKKSVPFNLKNIIIFIIGISISLCASIFSWQINIGSFRLSISLLLILFGLLLGVISVITMKGENK